MLSSSYAVLSCDVFSEELEALAGEDPPWQVLRYLEMGLHDRPDELLVRLQKEVASIEADPAIEAIALAYGRCGNGLVGLQAGRCPLILPQAHDCVSVLLGGPERHASILKDNPGTYFYTPGWVREKRVPGPDRAAYLREFYAERYPDDAEMVEELIDVDQEAFGQHNCAAYLSIIKRPAAEDYCRDCARHLGWTHRTLAGDASFLSDLLHGDWEDARFLKIAPGQCIAADNEGKLIARSPA